jgi:glycosyltransferase involved in cell wall biosynthesis
MRIAIINHGLFPFLMGGMERHTTFLAEHLTKLGASVEVIVPPLPPQGSMRLQELGFTFQVVECPWPKTSTWLQGNRLYSENVADYLDQKAFDLVYCQGFNGWGYLERQKPGAKTIYNPHGLEMFKTQGIWQTVKHWRMRRAARIQASLADATVSLGGRLTGEVEDFLKVPHDQIVILPNAVDLRYIDSFNKNSSVPREAQHFIFVGRLEFNKGVATLCQAFAELPQATLSIVGDGPLGTSLRAKYQSQKIRFLGKLTDRELFEHYRRSDCLVFASLYEGMPTVILEAMASGLPVIATDIGAVQTMVDATTGILVAPGSTSQLRKAVLDFMQMSPTTKELFRDRSRQKVAENFVWPQVAQQTLTFAEKLMAK